MHHFGNSSGSTGQLVEYICRYILEKEQKEATQKEAKAPVLSKEDIPFYLEAFKDGNLNFDEHPDAEIAVSRERVEQELDSAIRITKTTAIAKELAARAKADGTDLKKTTLHLTSQYLIARNKDGERFFKLSLPSLFSNIKPEPKSKEAPFIIRHNLRSRSIKGYIREFEKLESQRVHRRSNSVTVFHHILSFSSHDKEHVTDAMLRDMAAKFIALRGPDCQVVGTKHTDHDHIHIHLAMSAVDLAGRSVRISQSKFQEIKLDLDRYQKEKYPELVHSLPDHGKKQRLKNKEVVVEKYKTNRPTEKVTLCKVLETAYSKATSTEQFLSILQDKGYQAYYRSGTLTGVSVGTQYKFRFSKLGYTQEKLKGLDLTKDQEEKELAELRSLREGRGRDTVNERLAALNEIESASPGESNDLDEPQPGRDNSDNTQTSKDTRETGDQESDKESKEIDDQSNSDNDDGRSR